MSAARPDTRLVWAAVSPESRACARFSVYCTAPYSASSLGRCQLVLGVSEGEVAVRVYDRFLVWCRVPDCWCLQIHCSHTAHCSLWPLQVRAADILLGRQYHPGFPIPMI